MKMSMRVVSSLLGVLSALSATWAQGPMDGMSKSTLAAETDPLGAMAFIQNYFGTTPDSDSCDGNVCRCSPGDSNATDSWKAVLGRCDLVKAGYPAGKCVLRTSVGPMSPSSSSSVVIPSSVAGNDCSYTSNASVEVRSTPLFSV